MLSLRHGLLNYTFCQVTRVAEPEPPRAATFRKEPEPIFWFAGAEAAFFKAAPAPNAYFLANKRGQPCCCDKTLLKSNLQR